MAELQGKKEKSVTYNSLVCLLKALVGHVTTIELRNESTVEGKIMSVDSSMDVTMKFVTFCPPNIAHRQYQPSIKPKHSTGKGNGILEDGAIKFDEYFVHGRNIRFVHIPDVIDIKSAIEEQIEVLGAGARNMGGRVDREEFKHQRTIRAKENKERKKRLLVQKLEYMTKNLARLTEKNSTMLTE